ncbi:MAG: hypothetical protein NVSMB52_14070 [Chloroflexota bacterium]
MDDGAFNENFTWFEWGFVSPDDAPGDDWRSSQEANPVAYRPLEQWDEDHRWPT